MSSHRSILLSLMHLLQVIPPTAVCHLSSSVPLLFADEDQLFGYGTSGLYRTYGVVLLLECSIEDIGHGIVKMNIIDQNNVLIASQENLRNSSNTSKMLSLKQTVLYIIPGSKFLCLCITKRGSVKSIIHSDIAEVPTIQPCNSAQCENNNERLCYEKNEHILTNHSPSLCETSVLQRLKWNNALSKDIWNKQFINKWRLSHGHGHNVLKISYKSYNHHMGLCMDRFKHSGKSKFEMPLEQCQVHTAFIPHYIYSLNGSTNPEIATESCKYDKFDAMPMTLNGTAIYSGTIHYIEAYEHIQLKAADGYRSNSTSFYTSETFECTMFNWKRGSDPTKGNKFNMRSDQKAGNSIGNKIWIIKGTDLHPSNSDVVHMVGCTLTRTWTISSAGLLFSFDIIGMDTRQVEFFVSLIKGDVHPIYEEGKLRGCSTEGRTVTEDYNFDYTHNQCTCISLIYSCNPIRTIRNSVRRFPCTIPYTNTTLATRLKITSVESTSTQTTTDSTWLIVLSIIALVTLCNVAVLMVIFCRKTRVKEAYSNRSVTAREELSVEWSPNRIISPASFHSSDKTR